MPLVIGAFSFSLTEPNMKNITQFTLNQGQQAAAEEIFKWLLSSSREIIISGPGGVGKSYLISYLVDVIMPRYQNTVDLLNLEAKYDSVVMTATTNKAAEVLAEATNRPVSTIHSFLNLVVKNNFSNGTTYLQRGRAWEIKRDTILIIDEYSQIDKDVYKEICSSTYNCKIIFVGDHCQIAAVGDKTPYVSRQGIARIDLTEPMRNKDVPELQQVCSALRQTVESQIFGDIPIIPGIVDHIDDNLFMQEMDSFFLDPQTAEPNRILAYSNDRVNAYNEYVRSIRQLPEIPVADEHLICNTAYSPSAASKGFSTEEEVFIKSISNQTEIIQLPHNGSIEVVRGDIVGRHGELKYVPIPTNRSHLTELIKYYGRIKDWPTYFELKEKYPDLRPRDASTVHKSQGSSYDTVYVDLTDLSKCTVANTASRLLYVAVSRARKRVVLYGKLAPRYGRIVYE